MKIYNNTNITYSAIEHNSRKNTKQNVPADLEKKMTQYTDCLLYTSPSPRDTR